MIANHKHKYQIANACHTQIYTIDAVYCYLLPFHSMELSGVAPSTQASSRLRKVSNLPTQQTSAGHGCTQPQGRGKLTGDRDAQLKDIVCMGTQGTAIGVPPCEDDHAASGHILHIQNGPVTDEV